MWLSVYQQARKHVHRHQDITGYHARVQGTGDCLYLRLFRPGPLGAGVAHLFPPMCTESCWVVCKLRCRRCCLDRYLLASVHGQYGKLGLTVEADCMAIFMKIRSFKQATKASVAIFCRQSQIASRFQPVANVGVNTSPVCISTTHMLTVVTVDPLQSIAGDSQVIWPSDACQVC